MPFIERNKERDREKKKRKKGRHRKSTNNKSLSTKPRSAIIFFLCASFDMPVPKFVLPCGYTS